MNKQLFLLISSLLFLTACQQTPIEEKATATQKTEASIELQDEKMDSANLSLDPNSTECSDRVTEEDMLYGERQIWPLVRKYYSAHETSDLGTLFAAAACGEEALNEEFPTGKTKSGILITILPEPSSEFETALKTAGFTLNKEGPKYRIDEGQIEEEVPNSWHEEWVLSKQADIKSLLPLREFVNENWSSVWSGLSE